MLELFRKHPRIVALLVSSLLAGFSAALVCCPLHDTPHLIIYIIAAAISGGFWMAIIGKRIADVTQSCTYFRAAILGAIAHLLALLSVGILIDLEMRLENMFSGLASLRQTIRFLLIDDLATNLGGGIFALLFFGWYLVPMGGLAGILLRALRKLYEAAEPNEEDKEAELYEAHEGN